MNKGVNNKANPSTYSAKDVVLKKPKRAGYTFVGWYTDGKFRNSITTIIASEKGIWFLQCCEKGKSKKIIYAKT